MAPCCKNQHIKTRKIISNRNIMTIKSSYSLFAIVGIIFIALLYTIFSFVHNASQKKRKIALANLQWQVSNNVNSLGAESVTPEDLEARMRKWLPRLEELSRSMSSGDNSGERVLATWQAQLGLANKLPNPSNAWDRLWLAKRLIALGNNQAAESMLAPLRKSADLTKSWGPSFWFTLVSLDQLQGDREKGWKDIEEYKVRFKDQANPNIDRIMNGI